MKKSKLTDKRRQLFWKSEHSEKKPIRFENNTDKKSQQPSLSRKDKKEE